MLKMCKIKNSSSSTEGGSQDVKFSFFRRRLFLSFLALRSVDIGPQNKHNHF